MVCLCRGLRLSDLNKETTYLLNILLHNMCTDCDSSSVEFHCFPSSICCWRRNISHLWFHCRKALLWTAPGHILCSSTAKRTSRMSRIWSRILSGTRAPLRRRQAIPIQQCKIRPSVTSIDHYQIWCDWLRRWSLLIGVQQNARFVEFGLVRNSRQTLQRPFFVRTHRTTSSSPIAERLCCRVG